MTSKPTPEIDALMRATAEKYGIDYGLLYAQVKKESAFDPIAVSACGARGLMQIMPDTGIKDLGMKEADFFDPAKNLDAGARYLKRQYKAVRRMIENMPPSSVNDCSADCYWRLALAAYNGGLGYVIKAINLCHVERKPLNWVNISGMLADPRLVIGKRKLNPDEKQMIDYAEWIWARKEAAS